MKLLKVLLLVTCAFCVLSANATVVDLVATTSNTSAADGITDPWGGPRDSSTTAVTWRDRTDNGAWTADEDPHEYVMLKTDITGLIAGQRYEVYVNFISSPAANWTILGGLSSTGLEGFGRINETINGVDFIGANDVSGRVALVGVAPENTSLNIYRASLGEVTVDPSGIVSVFIDDIDNTNISPIDKNRVWYRGVAYEVVPEPLTMALLGFGALAIRRRKA